MSNSESGVYNGMISDIGTQSAGAEREFAGYVAACNTERMGKHLKIEGWDGSSTQPQHLTLE